MIIVILNSCITVNSSLPKRILLEEAGRSLPWTHVHFLLMQEISEIWSLFLGNCWRVFFSEIYVQRLKRCDFVSQFVFPPVVG